MVVLFGQHLSVMNIVIVAAAALIISRFVPSFASLSDKLTDFDFGGKAPAPTNADSSKHAAKIDKAANISAKI